MLKESDKVVICDSESANHVRDIRDPEHPYSLEQLSVLSEESITVDEKLGRILLSIVIVFFVFGPTVAIPCCDHAYFAILCLNSFLFFQDHVYSDNPALQYGDCHWTVLEREAQRLFPSTFQGQLSAFVGIGIESCLFRARTCYMQPLAHSLTFYVMYWYML